MTPNKGVARCQQYSMPGAEDRDLQQLQEPAFKQVSEALPMRCVFGPAPQQLCSRVYVC